MHYEVGTYNVKQVLLIDRANVLIPPHHIKLGLIKLFVERLDPESEDPMHILKVFCS